MFPGQCGNTAFFFKSQPDQFHFEFRGIVFPGKSFFSAHEVSTCKISGCLSYRILDSGPDGTQTTLTPSLLFKWKKQYQEGSLTAVAAGEEVVPASELTAALKQVRELQRLLGKKTMEVEILKEAVEYGQSRKWIAHAPLLPKDGE